MSKPAPKKKRPLRSQQWFGLDDRDALVHRSWMKNQGIPQRPVRRPAGDRHLQHLVRSHAMQRALPRPRGAGEARRVGRGRLPDRVSGDEPRRDADASDDDAVPQPDGDGRRGVDPRQSVRRRRAADGLRQDDASAADGRRVVRPADDRRVRRSDAERQVPRRGHRVRHARVEVHRDAEDRRDEAGGHARGRVVHVALARPLHDDGHGVDDGVDGRGARHGAADERGDSRGRLAAQACWRAWRAAASSRWCTRTCACRRS